MDERITKLEGLRAFYEPENPIGLLLDAIIADLSSGEVRDVTRADARLLLAGMDQHSTAYRIICELVGAE